MSPLFFNSLEIFVGSAGGFLSPSQLLSEDIFSKFQRRSWAFLTTQKKQNFGMNFALFFNFPHKNSTLTPKSDSQLHLFPEGLWWLGRNLRFCTVLSTTSQQGWKIPAEYCRHLRLPTQVLRCSQESSLGSR